MVGLSLLLLWVLADLLLLFRLLGFIFEDFFTILMLLRLLLLLLERKLAFFSELPVLTAGLLSFFVFLALKALAFFVAFLGTVRLTFRFFSFFPIFSFVATVVFCSLACFLMIFLFFGSFLLAVRFT